jgi:hypothetical protein
MQAKIHSGGRISAGRTSNSAAREGRTAVLACTCVVPEVVIDVHSDRSQKYHTGASDHFQFACRTSGVMLTHMCDGSMSRAAARVCSLEVVHMLPGRDSATYSFNPSPRHTRLLRALPSGPANRMQCSGAEVDRDILRRTFRAWFFVSQVHSLTHMVCTLKLVSYHVLYELSARRFE